jgi:hypothetical protein
MYTIIGSGFGIYGYLPALVEGFGETVVLPSIYKDKILSRRELASTVANIRWVKDENVALSLAKSIVIATTPERQFEVVMRCLSLSNIEKLIIEKPVAVTPERAAILVANLDAKKKRYRIGFTFLYTSWQKKLRWSKLLVSKDELTITWTFMANHFDKKLPTWKRNRTEGGGVLRFYGIHLVALLASQGYDGVLESKIEGDLPDEPLRWRAVLTGSGLANCNVFLDSFCTQKRFEISQSNSKNKRIILTAGDPFELECSDQCSDSRIGPLKRLIGTFEDDDSNVKSYYTNVINLWAAIERASSIQ